MKNVGENQLREVLNYEVRVPASGDQEEAVVKLSGSDFGVRVQAEHKFIGAVFAGLKPELWFNGERIDFGTEEALEREFETVVRVTGNNFHCEKWRRRFIRLIKWRAEEIRKQEIAVELSGVLNLTPEQIIEHLIVTGDKAYINLFALGVLGIKGIKKKVNSTLATYWYRDEIERKLSFEY